MRGNYQKFNFDNSLSRIDDILNSSANYEEANDIPKKDDLTYKSGKYVQCASLFIDLRGSSDLIKTQGRQSKTLARIYRAYISEIVAIVNSFQTCKEINIVGDCVSAMFAGKEEESNTPVIEALLASSKCNAMMNVLNVKFQKKWEELDELKAGIGVAIGRALVIKAGYNGSGINDLIYMGDVVNQASKMCGLAHKDFPSPICVTEDVYLSAGSYIVNPIEQKTFQDFLVERYHSKHGTVYTGAYLDSLLYDWSTANK